MELLDYMLDIAALLELEAQAFCYTRNNIANHVYVTNKIWFEMMIVLAQIIVLLLHAIQYIK